MKKILFFTLILPLLASCSDPEMERIKALTQLVEQQLTTLRHKLDKGQLRNAEILKHYANQIMDRKPEQKELAKLLMQEATPKSKAIADFEERLSDIKYKMKSAKDKRTITEDLQALAWGTKPDIYNDALIDTINVLADLSDDELPRIDAPPKQNGDTNPAERLVGNPTYGYWQTRGGQSFWVWYGKYRLFSDLLGFGGRPYYYHTWYNRRPWSYYHDYGHGIYGSRSYVNQNRNLYQSNRSRISSSSSSSRTRADFNSGGRRKNSYFTPSTSTARARKAATKSGGSSYGSRRSSRYSSSHRRSSRSRSYYGGK